MLLGNEIDANLAREHRCDKPVLNHWQGSLKVPSIERARGWTKDVTAQEYVGRGAKAINGKVSKS